MTGYSMDRARSGFERYDLLIVLALFAASRGLYALLGVEFDSSPYPGYFQFIDAPLLRTRLLESLWYFHAHPPLLNLFVGIGEKLFGDDAVVYFNVAFHALGLLLAATVYLLTRRLSASRVTAVLTTALLVFSPSFVLYENWLMYSFPAAALVVMAALALHEYIGTRKAVWGAAFFGLLATLLLTRSLFHLAWLVLIIGLVVVVLWERRWQVLKVASVPLLVVVLWYGKNYYLFGAFTASTMMGLGMSNVSTLTVPREQLEPLVQTGELSPLALVDRFTKAPLFFSSQKLAPMGVPVVDEISKSTGHYNWNNRQLIAINRIYARDALTAMRKFPRNYRAGVGLSNRLFFSPTSMNRFFTPENRDAVVPIERLYDPILYGARQMPEPAPQPVFGFVHSLALEVNTSSRLIIVWFLMLGYGYVHARRAIVDRKSGATPRAVVLGFFVVTAIYVHVVATTIELGENYRYRFLVEPLFFVVTAVAITDAVRWVRAKLEADKARATQPASVI